MDRNRTQLRIDKYGAILEHYNQGHIELDDYYQSVLKRAVAGLSNPEIAAELGVTRQAVENVLNRAAFKVTRWERKQGTWEPIQVRSKTETQAKAIELYDEGFNYGEIAIAMGISRTYVAELVKERNDQVTAEFSGGEDWVVEYWKKKEPKWMTPTESRDFCQRAEKAIILRRLARGWDVQMMASADRTKRGVILRSMHVTGTLDLIPESELWTYGRNGSKLPFDPNRKYWDKAESLWDKPHSFN